jgi:hypothetical protein
LLPSSLTDIGAMLDKLDEKQRDAVGKFLVELGKETKRTGKSKLLDLISQCCYNVVIL